MMGMSLAYSLFNPVEVSNALKDAKNFEVKQPTPAPMILAKKQDENSTGTSRFRSPTAQNLLPLESALQPYVPPQQDTSEFDFNLMEIINEVTDQDLLVAASQIETQHEKKMLTSTSTSLIKTNSQCQSELSASPLNIKESLVYM